MNTSKNRMLFLFWAIMILLADIAPVVGSVSLAEGVNSVEGRAAIEEGTPTEGAVFAVDNPTVAEPVLAEPLAASPGYELNIDSSGTLLGFVEGKEPTAGINLVIPAGVNRVGDQAFYGNANILSVNFGQVSNLTIGKGAFQNTGLTGNLDLLNVRVIEDLAFADNGIESLSNGDLERIGEAAFRDNRLEELDLTVSKVSKGAFQLNKLTVAKLEGVTVLSDSIFTGNPLADLILTGEDFPLTSSVFTGVDGQVMVDFPHSGQTSQDSSIYLVNPVDVTVSYLDRDSGTEIKSSESYTYERDAKPYTLERSVIARYALEEDAGYELTVDSIRFESLALTLYFRKSEDVEIIIDPAKEDVFLSSQTVTKEDLLKDVYVTTSSGEIKPALNPDGSVLEGLTFDPQEIAGQAKRSDTVVKYNYTDPVSKKVAAEATFTIKSSSTDIMKQEIGNGWRYEDFRYDYNNLIGLSDLGLQKYEQGNRSLVLPGINPLSEEPLKSIGASAFQNKQFTSVDFSKMSELESIHKRAFYNHQIMDLDFSGNPKLITIGEEAFSTGRYYSSGSLKNVNFSNNPALETIEKSAFQGNRIDNLDLSQTAIRTIAWNAFANNQISQYSLNPETLEEIGDHAFNDNQIVEVRLVDFPNLKRLGYEAFVGDSIEKIHLENLPSLEGSVVFEHNNLTSAFYKDLPKVTELVQHMAMNQNYSKLEELTMVGLDSLQRIGNKFAYRAEYYPRSGLQATFGSFPSLEIIEQGAFQNCHLKEFPFVTAKKLKSIGDVAFSTCDFQELDFTGLDQLESIGASAFAWNRLTSLKLSNLPKLSFIGDTAFWGNWGENEGSLGDFELSNLPLLTKIGGGAFARLGITSLSLSNLPMLNSISGFSENKLTVLELKDLPALKEIGGDLASQNSDLREVDIDLENLETIGGGAFYGTKIQRLHVHAPNLRYVGARAFYISDYTLSDLILPETEDYIMLEKPGYGETLVLSDDAADFSGTNIKLEIATPDSLSSPAKSFTFDRSDQVRIGDGYSQSSTYRPMTLYIRDNDMNGDGLADIQNIPGKLLVNPQEVKIVHYYVDDSGAKQVLKTLYYTNTGSLTYTPPVIPGYEVQPVDPLSYSGLTINEDLVYEVPYKKIIAENTANISLTVKRVGGLSYDNKWSSNNNPQADILIENSGSGSDAVFNNVLLDIVLPDYIDPKSIQGFDPGEDNIRIESVDPLTGNIKVRIDRLAGGSSIHLRGGFKFDVGKTPMHYQGSVSAVLTSEDGRLYALASSENYRWEYDSPRVYKGSSVGGHNSARGLLLVNDNHSPEIRYSINMQRIGRELDYILVEDYLPSYTTVDGEVVYAVFDPAENPGWELGEKNGVPVVRYRYTNLNRNVANYVIYLTLHYPRVKELTSITNKVECSYYIKDPAYDDRTMIDSAQVTDNVVKDSYKNPGNLLKMVDRERVVIEEASSGLLVNWDLAYQNNEYTEMLDADGNRIKVYDIENKNVVLRDVLNSDGSSSYEGYYSVRPDHKAVIRIYANRDAGDTALLAEKNVEAGEIYIIPEDLRPQVRAVLIDYGDLSLSYGDTVGARLQTQVMDYSSILLENGRDINHVYALADVYRNGSFLRQTNGSYDRSLPFILPVKSVYTQKTQALESPGNYTYSGKELVTYQLVNFQAKRAVTDSDIVLKDFRQVDLLPYGMEIVSIELSPHLKERGGRYTTEELADGRTKIEFTASKFSVSKEEGGTSVATIQARLNPDARSGVFTNVTYLDYSNPDVEAEYTKVQELEGGRALSTSSTSFTLRKSEQSHATKMIREMGGTWQTKIRTKPGAKFQYKLVVDDISQVTKSSINLVDLFPYLEDRTLVEAENGLRDSRGSQFVNEYLGIDSIRLRKADGSYEDVSADFDLLYIPSVEGFPMSSADGSLDEWVDRNAQGKEPDDPMGIVLKQKDGLTLSAPFKLEVVINMQAPVFPIEEEDLWANSFAINTFARKDNVTLSYIEANSVENMISPYCRDLIFEKVDENEKPLADARFKLSMDGYKDRFAISDDAGKVIFRDIPYKPFTVNEVKAPSGYQLSSEVYEYDPSGRNTDYEPGQEEMVHVFKNERTTEPQNPIYSVDLLKTGPHGRPLAFVEFCLTHLDSGKTYTAETNEYGKISFSRLYEGKYKLEEVRSVNGHSLMEDRYFRLDETTPDKKISLKLTNETFDVSLVKVGFPFINRQKEDYEIYKTEGHRLENVNFDLYDGTNDQLVTSCSTDDVGEAHFNNLEYGKVYYLVEKNTPASYAKRMDRISFKLDDQGKVYYVKGDQSYPYVDNVVLVSNYKEGLKSNVKIVKKDGEGQPLAGASFDLYQFRQGAYYKIDGKSSDDQGLVRFNDLPKGSYKIREAKSVDGFIRSKREYSFSVDPYESKLFEFEYVNPSSSLEVVKVEVIEGPFDSQELADARLKDLQVGGETGLFIRDLTIYKGLSDAEFRLTTLINGQESLLEPMSTVGEGGETVYRYDKLDTEKIYRLTESRPPVGYSGLDEEIVLDGKEVFLYDAPNHSLLVENKKLKGSLIVSKYASETGNLLDGVTFALYSSLQDDEQEQNELARIVTDKDGIARADNLDFGTYYVKEVEAAHPYSVLEEIKEVEVSEDLTSPVLTFYNNFLKRDIRILKKGSDGKALPDAVFALYRNDKLVESKASDDKGYVSFNNLPVVGAYRIKELKAPKNYRIVGNGEYDLVDLDEYDNNNPLVIENTKLFDLSVEKKWDDAENQDGVRPDKVVVKLLADNADTGKSLTLSEENDWKGSFDKLIEYKDGKRIAYTVEELDPGQNYQVTVSGSMDEGFVVTNSRSPETLEVSGKKTWDDAENQDGFRPEAITVRLFAGEEEVDVKQVTAGDGWAWTFENLPKYSKGALIDYMIREDLVDQYSSEIKGYDLINRHEPEKTSIEVSKVWEDSQNQDGIRPDKVKILLLADGEDTGKFLELSAESEWKGTFEDLDVYKEGQKITYTVREEDPGRGYKVAITGSAEEGIIVTNSRTPDPKPVKEPQSPKTGDGFRLDVYLMIMIWAILSLLYFRRKDREESAR